MHVQIADARIPVPLTRHDGHDTNDAFERCILFHNAGGREFAGSFPFLFNV